MQLVQTARQVVRAWMIVGLGILAAACGGGGSGGGGGGGAAGNASPVDVSVTLASPQQIEATLFEGTEMNFAALHLLADGDIGQLNGSTVYVIVEDPSSLFNDRPEVSLRREPPGAYVGLRGRNLAVPGRYQGSLKVHACLDIGCGSELRGSPLVVPYDVTVLSGVALERQTVEVTVPFGQVPPVQAVSVGLPDGLISWGANDATVYNPYEFLPGMQISSTTVGSSTTGVVSLALDAAPPGTYSRTVKVYSNVQPPREFSKHFEKTLTVTYTVTPDPSLDYVIAPAAGKFTRVLGDTLNGYTSRTLVANTGVVVRWRGVEYLSHPPAAEGHPNVNNWWLESPYLMTSTCYTTSFTSECLPPGTYTARVRFTLTKDGVDRDVYWPMTLEIVPQ